MLYKSTLMAVAPMVMMARAGVEFDLDDTPRICRDVCRPLAQLYRGCEVDLRGDNNDREEDQLEVQCFCTNESFDVRSVASQCQNCIRQYREDRGYVDGNDGNRGDDRDDDRDDNRDDLNDDRDDNRDDRDDDRDDNRDDRDDDRDDQNDDWDDNNDDNRTDDIDDDMDDDDRNGGRRNGKRQDDDDRDDDAWQDINDIVRTCGFTSTSIAFSSATAVPSSVSVTATRPTDVAQLTTTFTAASAAETGNNNNNGGGGGGNGNNDSSNSNNNDDNNDDGDNAAGMLAPLGAAGAFVVGAMALLA